MVGLCAQASDHFTWRGLVRVTVDQRRIKRPELEKVRRGLAISRETKGSQNEASTCPAGRTLYRCTGQASGALTIHGERLGVQVVGELVGRLRLILAQALGLRSECHGRRGVPRQPEVDCPL
jgi:hypothetical protein